MSFTEKAKIFNRGSLFSALESTFSKLQCYLSHLRSIFLDRIIHSDRLILFGKFFGRLVKGPFIEKAKIDNRGCLCRAPESTGCKLQYVPYLISVVCS